MAKRRRRKLKRWLYFPIALIAVAVATPIFLHFAGDGATKKVAETPAQVEEYIAEPTPTPIPVPDKLFAYYTGETWGYKDQAGRTYEAIDQTYEAAQEFSEGLAFVGDTTAGVLRWSLINMSGQVIAADLPYSEVRPFSGGYAAVKGAEGWGFLDAQGLEVVKPTYDMVGDCSVEKLVSGPPVQGTAPTGFAPLGAEATPAQEGVALPTEENTQPSGEGSELPVLGAGAPIGQTPDAGGMANPADSQGDQTGENQGAAIDPSAGGDPDWEAADGTAPAAGTIECGLAVVGKNNLFGYVAPGLGDNPPWITLMYATASPFGDGLAFVGVRQADESIRYSIIDKDASPQASIEGQGTYFSDLMAPVRKSSNQYVYYDASGVFNEAFIDAAAGGAAVFEDAKGFSDGLGPVKIGGLWGYIGKDSPNPVILPTYRDAMPFSDGLAVVQNDAGKWGAIDRNGQVRIAFDYDDLASFEDGYALGRKVDNYYAVSLMGEEAQLYVRPANAATATGREMVVQLSEGTMRVRSQASTDSEVLTFVENGTRVNVIGEEGEWSQVEIPGNITGYIKTQYLRTP